MPKIDELPDSPHFTIKTVSTQTGIRPITLRAWERRYNLLSPQRSENRYRLYSERDIAVLQWVKQRVDGGVAISSAARELKSMLIRGVLPEVLVQPPALLPRSQANPPEKYSASLYENLVNCQEEAAVEVLREAHALFDLTTVCLKIIVPCLVAVGESWHRGDIRIATEHFATTFLRGRLLAMLQGFPSRRGQPYIITGTAPSEMHEIGSLIMSVLLRREGYRVEYLGTDIPLEDLVDYASYEHPAMIILSATTERPAMELARLEERLRKLRPVPIFGYGGRIFTLKPELRQSVPGNYLGDTLNEAFSVVQRLLA